MPYGAVDKGTGAYLVKAEGAEMYWTKLNQREVGDLREGSRGPSHKETTVSLMTQGIELAKIPLAEFRALDAVRYVVEEEIRLHLETLREELKKAPKAAPPWRVEARLGTGHGWL